MTIRWAVLVAAILLPVPATAGYVYPGPYRAEVLRVTDSDVLEVRVAIWPALERVAAVRLRGVEVPDSNNPSCSHEWVIGEATKDLLRMLLTQSDGRVLLYDIADGKDGSHLQARVTLDEARHLDLATMVMNHLRPYGGDTSKGWCGQ